MLLAILMLLMAVSVCGVVLVVRFNVMLEWFSVVFNVVFKSDAELIVVVLLKAKLLMLLVIELL